MVILDYTVRVLATVAVVNGYMEIPEHPRPKVGLAIVLWLVLLAIWRVF